MALVLTATTASASVPGGVYGGGSGPQVAGSASASISTSGGSVNLPDGSAGVTIPQGALSQTALVTVAAVPRSQVTQSLGDFTPIGNRFAEIVAETSGGQAVTSFSKPITITFSYTQSELDAAGANEADLVIVYWDPGSQSWIPVPTAVNAANNTLTATLDHLTLFAVVVRKAPQLSDIASHWARADIEKLVKRGILSGFQDGTFRPDAALTRAEMARAVAVGRGLGPVAADFSDNSLIPSWAAGFAGAMKRAGVMVGFEDGSFRPGDGVTRAQLVAILVRLAGKEAEAKASAGSLSFADAADVPEWARGYVAVGVSGGLIRGFDDNTFRANAVATRGDIAALLARMLGLSS